MSDGAGNMPSERSQFGSIVAAKTCIVAIVISASTVSVANWIIDSLEASAARSLRALREEIQHTPIGGAQFWGKTRTIAGPGCRS